MCALQEASGQVHLNSLPLRNREQNVRRVIANARALFDDPGKRKCLSALCELADLHPDDVVAECHRRLEKQVTGELDKTPKERVLEAYRAGLRDQQAIARRAKVSIGNVRTYLCELRKEGHEIPHFKRGPR